MFLDLQGVKYSSEHYFINWKNRRLFFIQNDADDS